MPKEDNSPILTEYHNIHNVILSAAEVKTVRIFHIGKAVASIRTTLTELEHPQPSATIRTDNNTSHGILTSTIQ